MPTSDKQIEANRRNAQKSTGPRSQAGKLASSRNALKHGILARHTIIARDDYRESEDEFADLLSGLYDDCHPEGALEELLVQQIAICYWRLRRILHADAHEFGKNLAKIQKPPDTIDFYGETITFHDPVLPPTERLDVILRYSKSTQNEMYRALDYLDQLQRNRGSRQASPLPRLEPSE